MINTDKKPASVSRLAPAPITAGGRRISACQGGTGLWMPRQAKNKDAAWRVFEWFFGEEPAKDRASGGWGIPTLNSLIPLVPVQTHHQKRVLKVQENELKHFSVVSFTPYARADALDALFNQAAASVIYVVPILLIFLVAQRGFIAGMSTSGLK